MSERARVATEIIDVLRRGSGAGYIGEAISQLEHALQCAHFARKAGGSDELVAAALLHDIGHLVATPGAPDMAGLGILDHEHLGAEFLEERGFSSGVAALVRGHVQGKRYLALKSARYLTHLSEASRGTLAFQGGPMSEAEADTFEHDPRFRDKVQLRRCDEAAKQVGLAVAPLEAYRALLESV